MEEFPARQADPLMGVPPRRTGCAWTRLAGSREDRLPSSWARDALMVGAVNPHLAAWAIALRQLACAAKKVLLKLGSRRRLAGAGFRASPPGAFSRSAARARRTLEIIACEIITLPSFLNFMPEQTCVGQSASRPACSRKQGHFQARLTRGCKSTPQSPEAQAICNVSTLNEFDME